MVRGLSCVQRLCLALCVSFAHVATSGAQQLATNESSPVSSPRERVRLHDGWRFRRSERTPDNVVYDLRPDTGSEGLQVLKPWILPGANPFIRDPDQHHEPPPDPPTINVQYALKDYDDRNWAEVTVPHDWAIQLPFLEGEDPIIPPGMGLLPVHGVGWYRHTLEVTGDDLDKRIYLDIDGAMSYPMVWVNEHLVGGWPFGYNSFRLDITPYLEQGQTNVLAVRVENPNGISSRWYPGAGLYRNVWVTKTGPTHVAHWGTFITSRDVSSEGATLDLVVQVENSGKGCRQVDLVTDVFEYDAKTKQRGKHVAQFPPQAVRLRGHDRKEVNGSVTVANPQLWGPPPSQEPHLHVAITQLRQGDELLDSYETQFGIRSLAFDPVGGVFVNGEHVYLQGVNQHHDLGALGAAYNERAAERQLDVLRELGVNAIRMSHNPMAPELMDLADRFGFLVIGEIFDSWVQNKTDLDFHLIFRDWSEPDLRSFLRRDRNHPSVFAWSYGNEIPEQRSNDTAATAISVYLRDIIHEEDPTRPSTISLNVAWANSTLATTQDVISLNYQGEGIRYGPAYSHLVNGTHRTPQYDSFHARFPNRLIMGSEVASSLSTRGSFVFPVTPFNSAPVNDTSGGSSNGLDISAYELYTAEPGSSADRVFLTQDEKPYVAGGFVWSGWDYLGEPYWCEECRSGYWGIIDLAGFKKERFWLYQARWRPDLPMAHIVPHWNWSGREGQITPVHVFSSGDEAELFLNGESQGRLRRNPLEYRFRWDGVTYEPGELHVVTYKDGMGWANATVATTAEAAGLRIVADRDRIASDGEDLSFLTVEVVDKDGNVVPDADPTIVFDVSGVGRLVATDNGFAADKTPFPSATRKAFNGLCLGIVASSAGRTGTITVRAKSEGLGSAVIALQAT